MLNSGLKFRKKFFVFVLVFISVIFIGILIQQSNIIQTYDYRIMSYIQKHNFFLKNVFLFELLVSITFLGNSEAYIIIILPLVLFFYFNGLHDEIVCLLVVLFISVILNEFTKLIVHRVRPVNFFIISMQGYSYPSGHAMNSASFYLTLGEILSRKYNKKIINYIMYAIVFAISISRLFLGVHWLTDIIMGLLFGIFISKNIIYFTLKKWRN